MTNPLEIIDQINGAVNALREATEKKASIEEVKKINDAIDSLELKMKSPNFGSIEVKNGGYSDLEIKKATAFNSLLRNGVETKEIQDIMAEHKAMNGSTPADGGYLVPQVLFDQIIEAERVISPVRQVANVITIGIGNELQLPTKLTNALGGWVGETAARPATDSMTLSLNKIALGEVYANTMITTNLLEDQGFNLESYISNDQAQTFAELEGAAFINGDGINKPTGFLNGAGTTGISLVSSGAAADIAFNNVYDLIYGVKSAYAQNGKFMAKRTTIKELRIMKDSNGNYLWQPSNILGQPGTLAGYQILEAEDMPAIAANSIPLVFGDFKRAYTIVDKRNMTMVRDPYSNKPFIGLYTTKRVGGKLTLAEALIGLKVEV